MRLRFVMVSAFAALAAGCAGTVTLYPANEVAQKTGVITAEITKYGVGSGPIKLSMPDGEILTGQYTVMVGGSTAYGSVFASAYGPGGMATANGTGMTMDIPNSSNGVANAAGPKGTTAYCEFQNNNMAGHGFGACKISNGALYRMQY